MARYVAKWIAPMAKSAGVTPEALYSLFNNRDYYSPYTSEYRGLTLVRANGRACNGYKPTEDAIGKPLPPLIPKGKKKLNGGAIPEEAQGGEVQGKKWNEKLLMTRLAALLAGGPSTKTKARIGYYLKRAGFRDVRKLDEGKALEVLQRRGIDISRFEYEKPAGTPGSVKLVPDASTEYGTLLAQYNELAERLKQTMVSVDEKQARILALRGQRKAVRMMLKQYHDELLRVWKERFGSITSPLEYPLTAYSELKKDVEKGGGTISEEDDAG